MQSSSKDIADILKGVSSLDLVLGSNLFYGRMPPTPQDVVAVLENPGKAPLLALRKTQSVYYFDAVTVQVRSTSYDTGYNLLRSIMVHLHGHSETINDTEYAVIRALGSVQLLHRDENDRPVFYVNFECQRKDA